MKVLLTSNASYAPPQGGSTRSNLVWLEHLSRSGHACRVVCPTVDRSEAERLTTTVSGTQVYSVPDLARHTEVLHEHIQQFLPDWVLISSEDLTHVLLRQAQRSAPDRLIYLAHTPQFYPFGPASWFPDPKATAVVQEARAVVAIAHYTAKYIQEYCGRTAHVVHPPIYGEGPYPRFGSFDKGSVLMINPSVVKGISIFLALAERFPDITFAGLAGWGTTKADREAMARLPNVSVLGSVPGIDDVLRNARLLLMPSIWHEGFGLIAMEAMLRGLPVISSDAGGLVEAKQSTGYVIPVRPIERFEPVFDETHMPKPVDVPQDIRPWVEALRSLTSDRAAYEAEAERSRAAAVRFVSGLRAAEFEELLESLSPAEQSRRMSRELSTAKRELLLKRLRQRRETN